MCLYIKCEKDHASSNENSHDLIIGLIERILEYRTHNFPENVTKIRKSSFARGQARDPH